MRSYDNTDIQLIYKTKDQVYDSMKSRKTPAEHFLKAQAIRLLNKENNRSSPKLNEYDISVIYMNPDNLPNPKNLKDQTSQVLKRDLSKTENHSESSKKKVEKDKLKANDSD